VVTRSLQLPALGLGIGLIIGLIHRQADLPAAARDWGTVRWAVLAYFGLALFTNLVMHFRQRLALEFGEAVAHDLRDAVYRQLQRMPMAFFHHTRLGRLISRITSDVDVVRVVVQEVMFVGVVQIGQMLGAAAIMACYDWKLFLVVLAMVPILWALNRTFRFRLVQANREAQEGFSRLTAALAESVNGIRVTQGFVRQDVNGGLFRSLVLDQSRYNMGVAWLSAIFLPLLEFNGQLFTALLLIIGGMRALGHELPLETLITFFFVANLFFGPIPTLGNLYVQTLTGMAGAERIFALLERKPEWEDPPGAPELPPIRGRVEFAGVSFAYAEGRPVLHGIDIVAEPGQTVAPGRAHRLGQELDHQPAGEVLPAQRGARAGRRPGPGRVLDALAAPADVAWCCRATSSSAAASTTTSASAVPSHRCRGGSSPAGASIASISSKTCPRASPPWSASAAPASRSASASWCASRAR